jgi:hypothetical protein
LADGGTSQSLDFTISFLEEEIRAASCFGQILLGGLPDSTGLAMRCSDGALSGAPDFTVENFHEKYFAVYPYV